MVAYWTIRHAIDMKVLGVGFDVDAFTIEPSAKTYRARQLDDAEVAEHIDFIKECEQALRSVREAMTSPPDQRPVERLPPTL